MLEATGDKKGTLFFNPGGPGGSAVEVFDRAYMKHLDQRIREHFDVVLMDPRRTGKSAFTSELLQSYWSSRLNLDLTLKAYQPYISTQHNVQDLEALRQKL